MSNKSKIFSFEQVTTETNDIDNAKEFEFIESYLCYDDMMLSIKYFENSVLVKEVINNERGLPLIIFYYDKGMITRREHIVRDDNDVVIRTRVETFINGRQQRDSVQFI